MNVRFWHSKTFRFWFVCYLLILMLPTLFSVFFFSYTSDMLESNAYESGRSSINQVRDIADGYLEQIVNVSNTIHISSTINRIRYLSLPFNAKKYYELHQRASYLSNFSAQEALIEYLYVYYSDMDCILDSGHIYTDINQRDTVIKNRVGMSLDNFASCMQAQHPHEFRLTDDDKRILYLHTMDTRELERRPIITLIAVLNPDSLDKILLNTHQNSEGSVYMLLPDGGAFGYYDGDSPLDYEAISGTTESQWTQNIGQVVVYADSRISDFRYVLSVPCDTFMQQINNTQLLFIICLAVLLVLGVSASYALASRCYQPVHKLKEEAQIPEKSPDVFAALGGKLKELRASREETLKEVEQLNHIASERLFHLLVSGNLSNLSERHSDKLKHLFTGSVFVAAQIDCCAKSAEKETLENENLMDVLLNKLAEDLCDGVCEYLIRRDDDTYAGVFCFTEGTSDVDAQLAVGRIAEDLLSRLSQHLDIPAAIYVGDARHGVNEVGNSYENACKVREYAEFATVTDKRVLLYDEAIFSNRISWEDFDIVDAERRFVNLMLEGNYASGEQALNDIFSYYRCRDGMSLYVMRCRMFGVMNMMLNVLHEVEPDIDAAFYEETDPIETLLSARTMKELECSVFSIIDCLVGQQESKQPDIKDKLSLIEHYVATRYFDPNLSVQQIADAFGISLPYLSRSFKREKGLGMLDYINRYRLCKAKEMILADERITVNEVAEKVGYNSSQTLIRIFKRYEGVTPGNFRISGDETGVGKKGSSLE